MPKSVSLSLFVFDDSENEIQHRVPSSRGMSLMLRSLSRFFRVDVFLDRFYEKYLIARSLFSIYYMICFIFQACTSNDLFSFVKFYPVCVPKMNTELDKLSVLMQTKVKKGFQLFFQLN